MAKAYLGKISALVTANTSDFNSKLNASAKEVRSFASSMQSVLSRAETSATSSLRGIYTEAQKLERALKAAGTVRLSFKGIETGSLDDARRRLEQLFSVTQSITKPLEASAKALAGLSAEVQANFVPALVRAQKNTESLTASINNNEKVGSSRFSRVKKIVDSLNDALSRSVALQQKASSVLGASRSIELRAPRVDAAVAGAAARVQEIRGLPAGARGTKEIESIVASYEKAVQRLVTLQGRLDAAVASGKNTAQVTREIRKQADAVDKLNELYNRLKIGILAPFDQIAGQSQQAAAAFNALSSVSRTSIDSLKSAADAAVAAFVNTGRGIDEARAAVGRFEAAIKAAGAVDTIQSQMQSSSVVGGASPLDLLAKSSQSAFTQFSLLSNPLKTALLPSLQEAANAAISLGASVASGAEVGERKIQRLTQRLSDFSERFKNLSSFSLDGLFATPRDSRGIAQLNQSVVQLDQRFAGLSASSRSFLDPFTSQVIAAANAVRDAEIAEKPRREINKLVTAYRQAVKALESVLGQVERTQQAFSSATPQQALASRLDDLAERYDRLSEAGKKAARAAGEAAKAAVAAAQDQGASPTARTTARQALDVAETAVVSQERRDNVRDIFGSSRSSIDSYISRVEVLERRYQEMGKQERLALESQRAALKLAAENAASTGQDTEFTKLRKEAEAFEAALNRVKEARQEATATQFGPELPPGFGGRSDAGLGGSPDDPLRKIDQLRQKIVATRSAIESLPEPLQAQFIPALQQSENQLRALAAAGDVSGKNFKSAASSADSLSTSVGKVGAQANAVRALSDRFSDFNDALKTRAIASFTAELTVMENTVVGISQKMRGPALAAMRAYSVAVDEALNSGNIEDPAIQRTLAKLRAEFIAAAKQAGVSGQQLAASLKRAGDVGRGGFDRFSLALNQAAFAIDDFFSSTGGLEFKLRAISNNVTQLAFILGDTKGLFIGLGAVLAGQAAVAILKWVNGGRTAEDQTKALNEALARQKSLVEDLAQAFRSLGDSLTRDAFSPAARDANEFRKELNEIIKKQKELREARVADADPTVQRERANQNVINRRLESEENPGRRVALQRQLEESRVREREAARAANAGNATRDDVRRSLERAKARVGVALLPPATDAGSAAGREIEAARIRRQAAADAERATAGTEAQQRAAVDAEIMRLTPIAANGDALGFGSSAAAASSIAELNQVLAKLDSNGIARANNALVVSVLEGAKKVSDALAAAQSSIANADFGPSQIGAQADAVAKQLESLANQLEAATDEKTIQALKAQQAALLDQSKALRSAATSVERFAAVVDRVAKQLSDTVIQEVEGRAGQARREANAARGAVDAGVANVPAFNRPRAVADQRRRADQANEDRRRAEADVQRARAGQQEFELRRRQAGRLFEARAAAGTLGEEAQGLIRQRDQAQAVLDSGTASIQEQQQAAETLARVNARLDQLFQNSSLGRALAEFADGLDAASQAAVELDRQIRDQRASADRGRELTLTPGQRAAEELNQQIADIREYANRAAEESSGLPEDVAKIRNKMNEAIGRAEEDMMRQVAPTITGMADSVRNAVALGPSRAALNASDVTTTQGQQELNRLLRGDDPARDVDLVALQREANRLLEVIANKENPVAQ